jgi:hypothetical protein
MKGTSKGTKAFKARNLELSYGKKTKPTPYFIRVLTAHQKRKQIMTKHNITCRTKKRALMFKTP